MQHHAIITAVLLMAVLFPPRSVEMNLHVAPHEAVPLGP
jgi:hypothetical protein